MKTGDCKKKKDGADPGAEKQKMSAKRRRKKNMSTDKMEMNMKEQEQVYGGSNPMTGAEKDNLTGCWDGLIGKPIDGLVMGGVIDGRVLGVLADQEKNESNH